MRKQNRLYIFAFVVLLLIVVATRLPRMETTEFDVNESWGIWQTFGSLSDTLRWTPFDWGPLHFEVLSVWKDLVGIHPLPLRMLSLLPFLLSIAIVYRLAEQVAGSSDPRIPLLTAIAYCTLGASFYFSMLLRGYIFILTLMPLSIWLAHRYFKAPNWRRGILLALVMDAMFYTHPTAVSAFIVLGFFTLMFHLRRLWLWWFPGLVALIVALPEILTKLHTVTREVTGYNQAVIADNSLSALYASFAGNVLPIWAVIFIVATILIFYGTFRRRVSIRTLVLLMFWMATPFLLYLLNPLIGTYILVSLEHLPWVVIGFGLWVGIGFAQLPRRGVLLPAIALFFTLFVVTPDGLFQKLTSFTSVFPYLARDMQPGDALLLDPNFSIGYPEAWNYYTRVYFPDGLNVITSPDNHRRIWYVKQDGWQDPTTQTAVSSNRLPEEYFGPWDFLFRLYEAPPDTQGILFANGMRFHGAEILDDPQSGYAVYHDGETVHMRLWWSVDHPLPLDYSETIQFILTNGKLGAQTDGPPTPTEGPSATSQWVPGQLYVEDRTLTLPYPLGTAHVPHADQYKLYLGVYHYSDGKLIAAPGVTPANLLPIQTIWLKSWR